MSVTFKRKHSFIPKASWYTDHQDGQTNHGALQMEGNEAANNNGTQQQVNSNNLGGGSGKFSGEHDSECSSVTSDSAPG